MAASAVWKLEGENSLPSNCFPPRGIARRPAEGAGSWVVAFAEEQQTRFQASFNPQNNLQISPVSRNLVKSNIAGHFVNTSNTLDAKFLMQRHHVDTPSDLCSVNVNDMDLYNLNEGDFKQFVNVAYINAAENLLSLRPFNSFQNLRELELPVNGLRNLQVQIGDFPNLQVLDLSYNNLSANDVLSLGSLSKLKVLTLTGNGLHNIHQDMARPIIINQKEDEVPEIIPRFNELEVLMLDDNRLSDLSIFASLAALPQLRELNLDKNKIEIIPHLKVVGDRVVSEAHSSVGHRKSASSGRKSRASRKTSEKQSREVQSAPPPTMETSKKNVASATNLQDIDEKIPETSESLKTMSVGLGTPNPPFQQLRLLSITNNRIAEEECVLAVAAWPRLKHLVLHGNPVVSTNSGEPALMSHYLRRRLGINIHRFQPKSPVVKPHLVIPKEKGRKVNSVVPKIPKQPVDILINSMKSLPMHPHPPTTPHHVNTKKLPQPLQETEGDGENVFLTQIDETVEREDPAKPEQVTPSKMKTPRVKTPKQPDVPSRFKGYEILLDAKPDETLHEPLGIQGNVRALHRVLSLPTVYRTCDVTLNEVTPLYVPQKSRHLRALSVARNRDQHRLLTKKEKLKNSLAEMRNRNSYVADMPLEDALDNKSKNIPNYEADHLLMEVEEKYRFVREESLKASRQTRRIFEETKAAIEKL